MRNTSSSRMAERRINRNRLNSFARDASNYIFSFVTDQQMISTVAEFSKEKKKIVQKCVKKSSFLIASGNHEGEMRKDAYITHIYSRSKNITSIKENNMLLPSPYYAQRSVFTNGKLLIGFGGIGVRHEGLIQQFDGTKDNVLIHSKAFPVRPYSVTCMINDLILITGGIELLN